MIPMMTPTRKSSDDDRPMGLKFTRQNFFNFPSKRAADENNSNNNGGTTLKRNPSTSQQPPMMMPLHHHSHSNKRDSDMSSTNSLSPTPMLSPTLPARSPFRIRDSLQQQQQQQQASTNKISTSHDAINVTRMKRSSSSLLDEPPSIYSSISSSSSTNSSSSATTADDDLLVQELESMWKLKSPTSNKSLKEQQESLKLDINSDDMLLQLLISHAVIDAREYKVLTFEEFETLKQHHARLISRVKNSIQKLELDKKIQETSHSLSNLSSNKSRESVMLLLDEAVEADRKVKILSQRLDELKSEEIETQYQILQHTAGVLCLGLQKLENNNSVKSPLTPITTPNSPLKDDQVENRLKQKVHTLKSELETITNTLINMLKRYDLNFSSTNMNATDLLNQLEKQLKAYKAESKQFESQLSAAEDRYRIESMSEKKLEIQLRAAQSKNEAAEQKYNNLQREMDDLLAEIKKPSAQHEDWLPQDDFDFADDKNTRVEELEADLATAQENQKRFERELEMGYQQVAQLKATVSDMELASSKIQPQVALFQSREDELKREVQQYRDEVLNLRSEKEKWERTMKRKTIMQVMDGTSSSTAIQEKYEQQLEEQEQEYQAQLKEQAAFLDKTTRQCEELKKEHEKLLATCQDLEILILDKTRVLDARDVQVSQLEAQLQQQQQLAQAKQLQQEQQRANIPQHLQHEELIQLQEQFSAKEAVWIESSTAMEANFEGILKEFDRLTGTAMEFESDKRNYEKRIERLTQEVKELEANLTEEKTKNMGYEADTPTTASLRKEFRRMINDMKADHQRALEREFEEKKKLEKQLKDLKHEREMSRYERTNKGVQTLFMP